MIPKTTFDCYSIPQETASFPDWVTKQYGRNNIFEADSTAPGSCFVSQLILDVMLFCFHCGGY